MSLDDVVAAQRGDRPLPPRAVLLTFDDGYRSFYTHVYPLLMAFKYPAVLSVVGSFLDVPPRAQVRYGQGLVAARTSSAGSSSARCGARGWWRSVRTPTAFTRRSSRTPGRRGPRRDRARVHPPADGARVGERYPIELSQPSFGRRSSVFTLPFRPYIQLAIQLAQAAIDYAYDPRTGRYETDAEYGRRVREDLERNSELLAAQLGERPRVITWPYGRWNEVLLAEARRGGYAHQLDARHGAGRRSRSSDASVASTRRATPISGSCRPSSREPRPAAAAARPLREPGRDVRALGRGAGGPARPDPRPGRWRSTRTWSCGPRLSAPGGRRVLLDRSIAGSGRHLQPCGLADLHADRCRDLPVAADRPGGPGHRYRRRGVRRAGEDRCPSMGSAWSARGRGLSGPPIAADRGLSRWDPRTPRRMRQLAGCGADAPAGSAELRLYEAVAQYQSSGEGARHR